MEAGSDDIQSFARLKKPNIIKGDTMFSAEKKNNVAFDIEAVDNSDDSHAENEEFPSKRSGN